VSPTRGVANVVIVAFDGDLSEMAPDVIDTLVVPGGSGVRAARRMT